MNDANEQQEFVIHELYELKLMIEEIYNAADALDTLSVVPFMPVQFEPGIYLRLVVGDSGIICSRSIEARGTLPDKQDSTQGG